ncbi:MAG: DUF4972 domain-containing protein [Dysgonamonadaceae bacterium]
MKNNYLLLFVCLLMLSFLGISCSEDKQNSLPTLNLEEMDTYIAKMNNILDTAHVGETDGTFPRENQIALQNALVTLQTGKSKAEAGEFILQYEIDNYCIAAKKAIQDFMDSFQQTLLAGTDAELRVFGIDQKGHIEFGASADYGGGDAFTVEAWLKYNSGFFESAIGDFITTFNNTAIPYEGWMINFMGSNLRATIGMGPQSGRVLEFGAAYPTNYGEWNHIAIVYNASLAEGQLKMYVNGNLLFEKTNDIYDSNNVLQSYQPNVANTNMWAFQEPTDLSRCMTGYIKKFRMWNSAKSIDQINTLKNSDVTGNEEGLICAWDFTKVPTDPTNIPDKTGRHSAVLVGKYKWYTLN